MDLIFKNIFAALSLVDGIENIPDLGDFKVAQVESFSGS